MRSLRLARIPARPPARPPASPRVCARPPARLLEERDAAMADYFATLGGLQPLEWKLRDLFVEAVRRAGGSSRIAGLLNGDMAMQAAWQDLKRKWLQMSPPLEAFPRPGVGDGRPRGIKRNRRGHFASRGRLRMSTD